MGMKSDQKKSDQLKIKNVTDPDEGTYLQPLLSWTTDLEREPAMGMQLNSPPTKLATPWCCGSFLKISFDIFSKLGRSAVRNIILF